MKKLISILLVCAMLIGVAACVCSPRPGASDTPEPSASADTITQTPNATEEPTQHIKTQADFDFEAIDLEIFISAVTSDGLSYHQYVIDSEFFGIDEADVERGWGELTREADRAGYAENREILAKLNSIDREQLSDMNKLAYDNLLKCIELSNVSEDYYYYGEPLTTLNGEHTMIPLMMVLYEINAAEDVENYLYLLEDTPRYIGQIAQFEIEKAAEGLFMTENALWQVLASCRDFAAEGEKCFLIDHFESVMSENNFGLSDAEIEAYIVRNKSCVINELLPAYDELADTLESLRGKCSDFVGASERGEKTVEYYKLGMQTRGACMLDSDKIAGMLETICSDTFTRMYQEIISDMSAINDYEKAVTSGNVEEDVDYLLKLIADIYPSVSEQQISYVTVPDAVAEDFSPAAYLISAFDDPSRNIVLLNPTSQDDNMLFTMAHECFPGHLYQTQYFRALDGLSLAQQAIAPIGYTEGWAVFSELMIAGEAEEYGTSICTIKQLESILCNILIPAYVSTMVNLRGGTKAEIREYLVQFGLDVDDYVDILYEYAVDMPLYFFDYALGYMYTTLIYDSVEPKTVEEKNAFFTEYLGYGPCQFDILFDKFDIEP